LAWSVGINGILFLHEPEIGGSELEKGRNLRLDSAGSDNQRRLGISLSRDLLADAEQAVGEVAGCTARWGTAYDLANVRMSYVQPSRQGEELGLARAGGASDNYNAKPSRFEGFGEAMAGISAKPPCDCARDMVVNRAEDVNARECEGARS
jgi:hypothetical protein